jgi:hypothetical protein
VCTPNLGIGYRLADIVVMCIRPPRPVPFMSHVHGQCLASWELFKSTDNERNLAINSEEKYCCSL